MGRRSFLILGILVIALGIGVSSAAFTVHQTTQAIVLQLGEPKRVVTEAGMAVVVHKTGGDLIDYQTADLGKAYLRGPMSDEVQARAPILDRSRSSL